MTVSAQKKIKIPITVASILIALQTLLPAHGQEAQTRRASVAPVSTTSDVHADTSKTLPFFKDSKPGSPPEFPVPVVSNSSQATADIIPPDSVITIIDGPCNYVGALRAKIRRQWLPPKLSESTQIKVLFTIAKDGKVTNAHISKTSGVAAADSAALAAIEKASPFWPLPSKSPAFVDLEYTFDYHVPAPGAGPAPRRAEEMETGPAPAVGPYDWQPYLSDLQRRVMRAWSPPHVYKPVQVVFTVAKDGQMTNAHVTLSSGNQKADAAALKAIEQASPFRPLHDKAPPSIDIELTFDCERANKNSKAVLLGL